MDSSERLVDKLCLEDGTDQQPCHWVHRGRCQVSPPPTRQCARVSIRVGDYNTQQVLVDNGSFADILYYPAFQQVRIYREWLVSVNAPLVGFGGTRVHPLGAITLSVTVSDYPQRITKDVTFLVVDCSSA